MQELKLVLVGDTGIGKSCLHNTYVTNTFPRECVTTVFDDHCSKVQVGEHFNITLWDTPGLYDLEPTRRCIYRKTDVFLVCFSVERQESLDNVKDKWIPEICDNCPGTPFVVVACKRDLRGSEGNDKPCSCVTYDEGYAVAKEIKAVAYIETSAMTQEGLKLYVDQAITSVLANTSARKKKGKDGFPFGRKLPFPVMPPVASMIQIEKSTFADDWYKTLKDSKCHDVTFLVEGTRRLHAHRVVLCSASSFFCKILASSLPSKNLQQHELNQIDSFSREDINSGKIEGISSVYEVDTQFGQDTIIELSADIKVKTFVRVLEFLYTGLPRLPKDAGQEDIQELRRVSIVFKLPALTSICDNLEKEEEFCNRKVSTNHMDEMGKKMKQLFFNQDPYADVVFNVEGTEIFAHKVVLTTRSDVIAAMLCGSFAGACGSQKAVANIQNTTTENFLALLEYLYTDHAPLKKGSDGIGVLLLADEYCQRRLVNICELYISKEIDRICKKRIEEAEIDVIGVLNTARDVHAKQLVTFCLHYVSTNFVAFSKRKEFSDLSVEDKKYVDEHRWPPLSYPEEVKEFKQYKPKKHCIII